MKIGITKCRKFTFFIYIKIIFKKLNKKYLIQILSHFTPESNLYRTFACMYNILVTGLVEVTPSVSDLR